MLWPFVTVAHTLDYFNCYERSVRTSDLYSCTDCTMYNAWRCVFTVRSCTSHERKPQAGTSISIPTLNISATFHILNGAVDSLRGGMPHIWGGADLVRPLSSNAASRFSHFHMRPIARAGLDAEDSILDTSGSFVVEPIPPEENDELPGSAAPTAQTSQPRQLEMNCLYYGVSHGALGVLSCRQVCD